MTEETVWKILSLAALVIGYLIKALVDSLRKNDKSRIYICPLDKSGITSKMNDIAKDIDKQENKLNNITTTMNYNKILVENIHEHYTKIADSLNKLVNISEQQTKLLDKISRNGH